MSQKAYYPLTSPQLSIWYTERMFPGTSISNVASTLRIKEKVNFGLLEEAIQLFIKNNDGIRLQLFLDENGNPRQYLSEYVEKIIPYKDFTSYEDPEKAFYDWSNEMTLKPFELLNKELYSFTMVKINNLEGGIYLITHHSISDAWNMSLIANFIVDYYCKMKNGIIEETILLTRPSYLSFIENDISYKDSKKFEEDKLFWEQTFNRVPEVTILKTRKTNLKTAKSKRRTFVAPVKFVNKLKEFCQTYKTTIYPLFMSALSMYIFRVTGKEEIILGTPILNRLNKSDKNTSGMFVSTIPLRIDINAEEPFITLCEKVREVCSTAYRHQRFPYDQILRIVRDKHGIKENLYDIVLSYQNAKFKKSYEIDYTTFWHFNGYQSNSLTVHINERDGEDTLIIDYDYHEDLFYDKEIEYLHQHFLSLLWHALDNPEKMLCKIEMLPETEKKKVLYDFNNTEMDYPREKLIHQLFEEQVARTPDHVAIVFEGKTMTYRELNEKVNQLAYALRGKGVKRDNIIGIMVPRSFELIIGIMAILKAGGAFMTIESDYPPERIRFMIENSKASILLTSNGTQYDYCENNINIFDESVYKNESKKNLEYINTSSDLVYVIYTSGTTGFPKGVMIEHKALHNFVCSMTKEFSYDQFSVVLSVASICFDLFIMEFMPVILSGAKLVLANKEQQNLPFMVSKIIKENLVSDILFTPSRMKLLIDDENYNDCLANIKHIMLGGEKLEPQLVKKIKTLSNAYILNAYGPTESTIAATFKNITGFDKVTIGKPIGNTKVFILDRFNNPVPINTEGELYISEECLARGYVNNPELTNEMFTKSPFSNNEKFYKTGDLARWYPKGDIEYLGRKDKQVKIMGYRIELGEIENALRRVPQVKDAAVDIRKNQLHRDTICAYYVSDDLIQPNEIKRFLKNHIPQYMIPHFLMQIESIPINANGKKDLKKIPDIQYIKNPPDKAFVLPDNELEYKLYDILCKILSISRISVEDDIFELGADSLTVIQLISNLDMEGYKVNVEEIYMNPTIRQISDYLHNTKKFANRSASYNKQDVVINNIVHSISIGSMPKLDSAALCYIPYNANFNIKEDKPEIFSYMKTSLGSIGTFLLPITLTELFTQKNKLLDLCSLAFERASYLGAKVVSLTGLLPSATNYGNDFSPDKNSNIKITTGHATIAAAILLSIDKIRKECNRNIDKEKVVILGTESIGCASTKLLLSLYPKIEKLSLFDIEKRKCKMNGLISYIQQNSMSEVNCCSFINQLPFEFYQASLIIYDINIPEIIDIDLLNPGTILVGVSEPKCFSKSKAIKRVIEKGDLLFFEGGYVRSYTEIERITSIQKLDKTEEDLDNISKAYPQIFSKNDITGCIFSSILIERYKLTPIIGNNIDLSECQKHYKILNENNYSASSYKIDDYVIPEHVIHYFCENYSSLSSENMDI